MKSLDENVNLDFIRQKAIKIAITEIKPVKLCRNYNLKDLNNWPRMFLKSSTIFDIYEPVRLNWKTVTSVVN